LEDRNYLTFSLRFGIIANVFLEEYEIKTDESVFVGTEIRNEKGWIVSESAHVIYRPLID
jgi:hypothetical protein